MLRNATLSGTTLGLISDISATIGIENIGDAPDKPSKLLKNGEWLAFKQDGKAEVITVTVAYENLNFNLPNLFLRMALY